jgi:hypothetical protein
MVDILSAATRLVEVKLLCTVLAQVGWSQRSKWCDSLVPKAKGSPDAVRHRVATAVSTRFRVGKTPSSTTTELKILAQTMLLDVINL